MNLQHAMQKFEEYLDRYERENDKVRLKIVHTYGVVEFSRQIGERLRLSREETELAQLIGLLHDIGRFEQLKRFASFEPGTMDHAAFGAEILFGEGMIRQFLKEDSWDRIIYTAIRKHSDFRLTGVEDKRELLHAQLIRDADKLDNCRVKLEEDVETLLDVSAEEAGCTEISPVVFRQFMKKESIRAETRRTKMDYWLSYLAYFFDLNFTVSRDILREHRFAERIIDRIPYSNPQTAEQMGQVKEILVSWI